MERIENKFKFKRFKSEFNKLSEMQISNDRYVVISEKITNISKKISIAQRQEMVDEDTGEKREVFFPYALTLTNEQARDLAIEILKKVK